MPSTPLPPPCHLALCQPDPPCLSLPLAGRQPAQSSHAAVQPSWAPCSTPSGLPVSQALLARTCGHAVGARSPATQLLSNLVFPACLLTYAHLLADGVLTLGVASRVREGQGARVGVGGRGQCHPDLGGAEAADWVSARQPCPRSPTQPDLTRPEPSL